MPLQTPPSESIPPAPPVARPLWRSKTLYAAMAMMVVGLVLWIARPHTHQSPAGPPASPASSGFVESASRDDDATGAARAATSKPPLLFRLGSSFVAAYFIGYAFRKFLKWSLVVSGAVLSAIFVVKHFGIFDLDWGAVEGQVSQGVSWIHGQAGAVRSFVTGFLPSAAATFAGLFMGARRS